MLYIINFIIVSISFFIIINAKVFNNLVYQIFSLRGLNKNYQKKGYSFNNI